MFAKTKMTSPSYSGDYTMDPADADFQPINDSETSTIGNNDNAPIANYFQLFDKALVQHTIDIQLSSSRMRDSTKTLFLKDLIVISDYFNESLFEFFVWIFSDPLKEDFLSKVCNIRVIHFHSKKELMKIFINPDSRCLVNHGHKLWVSRCLKGWKNLCMQEGNLKEQHIAEIMLSDLENGLTYDVDDVISPRGNQGFSRTDNMYEYENLHPANFEMENIHPRGYPSYPMPMDFEDNNTIRRASQDYGMSEPMHRRSMSFTTDRSDFASVSNYQRPPSAALQRSYSGMEFQKSVDNDASKDIELLNLRRELAFRQSQSNPLKDMTNVREETNEQRKLEGALREMMEYYDKALQSKDSQLDALQKELTEKEQKFAEEIKSQQSSLEEARSFYVRDLEDGKLMNEYQIKLQKELQLMKESYEKDAAEKAMRFNEREVYYENVVLQMKSDFSTKEEQNCNIIQQMKSDFSLKEMQKDRELQEKIVASENNLKQLLLDALSPETSPNNRMFDNIPDNNSSLINCIQAFRSSIGNELSMKAGELQEFEQKERMYNSLLIDKDNNTQMLLIQKENEFRGILANAENALKSSLVQRESEYKQKISERVNNLELLLLQREKDFKKIFSEKVFALENKISERESYFKSLLSDKESILLEKDNEIKRLSVQIGRAGKELEREVASKIEQYSFEMNRLIEENKDVQASYSCVIAIEKERVNLISKLEEELERKRNQVAPLSPKEVEDDEKNAIKLVEKKYTVKCMEYSELLQKQSSFQNQKSFFMNELEKMKKARDSEYTKLLRELSQKEDKLAEMIADKSKGVDSLRTKQELEAQVQLDALNDQKRRLEKELQEAKMELSMKDFSKESFKTVNEVKQSLEQSNPKVNDISYEHLHRDIDIIVKHEHEQALYINELENSVATFHAEYESVENELQTFKTKYFQLVDSISKLKSLDSVQTFTAVKEIEAPVVKYEASQPVVEEVKFKESSNVFGKDIIGELPSIVIKNEDIPVEFEKISPPKKKISDLINKFDSRSESADSVINIPKTIRSPIKSPNKSWIKSGNQSNQFTAPSSPTPENAALYKNSTVDMKTEIAISDIKVEDNSTELVENIPDVPIVGNLEDANTIAYVDLEITNEVATPVIDDLGNPNKESIVTNTEINLISPSESRNTLSTSQSLPSIAISPSSSLANYKSTSLDSLCVSEVSEESLFVNKDIVEAYKSKYLALQVEVPKPLSFAMERTISNENLKKNPLNSPPSAKLKFRTAEVLKAKTLFQDKLSETNTLIQNPACPPQSPQSKDDNSDNRRSSAKNDDKLPSKVSVLKIALAKSSLELSKLFGINGTEVFDGEMMKKKFTSDFVFKDNFLWINAQTRSLHWVDEESEKSNTKISQYLLLDKNDISKKLQGEMMGVVKSVVELSNARIVVTTESGEKLELKMASDNSASMWTKVIKMMT